MCGGIGDWVGRTWSDMARRGTLKKHNTQGSWLHDHEIVSMCAIFLLGYVSIIFENIFEFNKVRACIL